MCKGPAAVLRQQASLSPQDYYSSPFKLPSETVKCAVSDELAALIEENLDSGKFCLGFNNMGREVLKGDA